MKPTLGLNHSTQSKAWGGCSCWQPSSPPLSRHKSPKICCNTGQHGSFCSHLKESYCSDSPTSLFQEDTAKSSLSGQMIFFRNPGCSGTIIFPFLKPFSKESSLLPQAKHCYPHTGGKGMAQAPSQEGLTLESSSKLVAEQRPGRKPPF